MLPSWARLTLAPERPCLALRVVPFCLSPRLFHPQLAADVVSERSGDPGASWCLQCLEPPLLRALPRLSPRQLTSLLERLVSSSDGPRLATSWFRRRPPPSSPPQPSPEGAHAAIADSALRPLLGAVLCRLLGELDALSHGPGAAPEAGAGQGSAGGGAARRRQGWDVRLLARLHEALMELSVQLVAEASAADLAHAPSAPGGEGEGGAALWRVAASVQRLCERVLSASGTSRKAGAAWDLAGVGADDAATAVDTGDTTTDACALRAALGQLTHRRSGGESGGDAGRAEDAWLVHHASVLLSAADLSTPYPSR